MRCARPVPCTTLSSHSWITCAPLYDGKLHLATMAHGSILQFERFAE